MTLGIFAVDQNAFEIDNHKLPNAWLKNLVHEIS